MVALSIILFRVLVDLNYQVTAHRFDYQGLFWSNSSDLSVFLSWLFLCALLPLILWVFRARSLSSVVLSLLVLVSLIPTTSAIAHRADYELSFVFLMFAYWFVLLFLWSIIPVIRLPIGNYSFKWFHLMVGAALCCAVIFYSWKNTGLRLHFGLFDVYDLREEARNFDAPVIVNYLVAFADNLLPFFLVYALYRRNYLVAGFLALVVLLNFSITGTKQVLFLLFLGPLSFYFVKRFSRVRLAPFGLALVLVFCLIEVAFFDSAPLSTLFAYRVMFIPAELHYSYFSFFQGGDYDYFAQSLLKWLLVSPYSDNIQFLLGEYSIGDFSARANNGLFSDAYSNLGPLGVVVLPAAIALLLRILDGAAQGLPERILLIVAIYLTFVFLGMTLSTALLSSGVVLLIILLSMLPRLESSRNHIASGPELTTS